MPPALGGTGKRERRYFDTQKAAKEFCKQQRIRLENYGTASTLLPAGKIEEAQTAFDRLSPFGISLLAAVDHYLEWRKNQEQTVTFKGLFEKFIESKADRSQPYRTALHYTLPRFPTLHDRLAFDIAPGEIEDALVGLSQSVRNAFLRNIRAAFNFGIRRGWCEKNPVSRIEMEPLKPRRKILTNPQVEALLAAAVKEDIELLPYLLFCIFAGIRPQEVERLEWSNVNLDEGHVVIPEEASKTDTRRVVEMEPLLRRWLSYFIERRGEQTGAIIVTSNFRKRLRAIRKAAGLEIWPQDAPRRTYASCWLAIHEKVDRLNYFMGHTSPAMLYRHYHRAVTLNQAKEFWEIEPPRSPKKRTPRKKRT